MTTIDSPHYIGKAKLMVAVPSSAVLFTFMIEHLQNDGIGSVQNKKILGHCLHKP